MDDGREIPIQGSKRGGFVGKKCKAKAKSTGAPCKNNAIKGLEVCRVHGGATKRAREKGARVHAEQEVRRKVGALLAEQELVYEDPLEGLMIEVSRSSHAVRAYETLVRELEAIPTYRVVDLESDVSDEIEDGSKIPTLVPSGVIGPNHLGDLGAHPFVVLWSKEREWHAKVCKMALDAGVAERQVRLAERQGELLAQTIERLLGDPDLALTHEQRQVGRQVAARHLRALPEAV